MATIVKMPAPRARSADTAALHGEATILFFTGVRYVREIDAEDDAETDAVLAHVADDQGVHAAV